MHRQFFSIKFVKAKHNYLVPHRIYINPSNKVLLIMQFAACIYCICLGLLKSPILAFTLLTYTHTQFTREAVLTALLSETWQPDHYQLNYSSPHKLICALLTSKNKISIRYKQVIDKLAQKGKCPKISLHSSPIGYR